MNDRKKPTTTRRWRSLGRRVFIGMLGALVFGGLLSWSVAGWLVAPSDSVIGDPPADLPGVSISLPTDSGSIVAGWHVPAEPSRGVVTLLHGKGGSRLSMKSRARFLHAAGYSIVMIDLRAHGETPGQWITLGHLEQHDVRAAVEFARQAHPDEPLAVLGISLGGAAALLASPLGIDALVLESVFPSITDAVENRVAEFLGPLGVIPAQLLLVQLKPRLGITAAELRPIDSMPRTNCPVLIISGTDDPRTTPAESQEMYSAAKEPKELWLVPGATHGDMHRVAAEEYERRVLQFLDRHLRPQPQETLSKR